MNEYHHLMAFTDKRTDLVKHYLVEVFALLGRIWFAPHTNEMLLERNRSERGVEVKQASVL